MSIDDRLERLGLTPELIERWHEVNDPEPNDEHHQPEPDDGPDPATLRWLDEQTTPPTTARPTTDTLNLRWVHDALDNPPPEPPELVEGFMRAGEIIAIAAPRAIGKSWLTYNLAALLDRGEGNFLGQLPIRQKVRTLIAQGEIDEWNAWDRWPHPPRLARAMRPSDGHRRRDRTEAQPHARRTGLPRRPLPLGQTVRTPRDDRQRRHRPEELPRRQPEPRATPHVDRRRSHERLTMLDAHPARVLYSRGTYP